MGFWLDSLRSNKGWHKNDQLKIVLDFWPDRTYLYFSQENNLILALLRSAMLIDLKAPVPHNDLNNANFFKLDDAVMNLESLAFTVCKKWQVVYKRLVLGSPMSAEQFDKWAGLPSSGNSWNYQGKVEGVWLFGKRIR